MRRGELEVARMSEEAGELGGQEAQELLGSRGFTVLRRSQQSVNGFREKSKPLESLTQKLVVTFK